MAEVKLGLNLNKLEVGLLFGVGALVLALQEKEEVIGSVERLARLALGFMDAEEPAEHTERVERNRATDRGEEAQPYEGAEHRGGEPVGHERGLADT